MRPEIPSHDCGFDRFDKATAFPNLSGVTPEAMVSRATSASMPTNGACGRRYPSRHDTAADGRPWAERRPIAELVGRN